MTSVLPTILDYYLNLIHSEIRIEGLETLDYLDNLCQKERFTEQGDAITFESEVYFSIQATSTQNFVVIDER